MKKRQISSGIVLGFLGQFISVAVGLAYTPAMTRILGQSEYGLYQLVQSVVNYLTLVNFGFTGAYIRYYSLAKAKKDEKEIANINGMFLNIFMLLAGIVLIGGIVLYFNVGILGSNLTAEEYVTAKKLLIIMVVNLALSLPSSLFMVFISANEHFVFQKLVNIICNLLIPLVNLPILLLGYRSVGLASATLFLAIVRLVINMVYCIRKLEMQINFLFFDKAVFLNLLAFTFFIFLSDLVDQLNSNVDKLLLGRLRGTASVAIYSVAYNLKNYYTTMTWIVPEMFIPEVNRLATEENSASKLTDLMIKTGRLNNFIVLLIISGFILCGRQFISLWVGNDYMISYYAAVILMIAGYVPAVQTLGVNIQTAKNKHQIRSIVYFCVACINVLSSTLLIRRWGVVGTCLGTLLAVLMGNGAFMNYYYFRHLGINIPGFWAEILKSVPFCAIAVLLGVGYVKLVPITGWGSLILFIFVYSVIYLALLLCLGLNKEEKDILCQKLVRKGV